MPEPREVFEPFDEETPTTTLDTDISGLPQELNASLLDPEELVEGAPTFCVVDMREVLEDDEPYLEEQAGKNIHAPTQSAAKELSQPEEPISDSMVLQDPEGRVVETESVQQLRDETSSESTVAEERDELGQDLECEEETEILPPIPVELGSLAVAAAPEAATCPYAIDINDGQMDTESPEVEPVEETTPDEKAIPRYSPDDPELDKKAWEIQGAAQKELLEIVKPMGEAIHRIVTERAQENDFVARETENVEVQHGQPAGEAYTLPPTLFALLDQDGRPPIIPDSREACEDIVEEYRGRLFQPVSDPSDAEVITISDDAIDKLPDRMMAMRDRGIEIDPDKWEQYRDAAREKYAKGVYDIDILSHRRGVSVALARGAEGNGAFIKAHATRLSDTILVAPTKAIHVGGSYAGLVPVGYLFAPVGEYGSEFSEKLLRSTVACVDATGEEIGPVIADIAENHYDTAVKYMQRGDDVQGGRSMEDALTMASQEAQRSVMEVVSLLMSEKVDGFEDPEQLFDEIIKQNMVEKFTRAVPIALTGPLSLEGRHFPGLLQNNDGQLTLNPEIVEPLTEYRKAITAHQIDRWERYREDPGGDSTPGTLGLVCPALMQGTMRKVTAGLQAAMRTA